MIDIKNNHPILTKKKQKQYSAMPTKNKICSMSELKFANITDVRINLPIIPNEKQNQDSAILSKIKVRQ